MFLEPKKDFRTSDQSKGWGDVVDGLQFQCAAKAALLQMQIELSGVLEDKPETDARQQQMLRGARRFLEILMSLTDTATPAPKPPSKTLTYQS